MSYEKQGYPDQSAPPPGFQPPMTNQPGYPAAPPAYDQGYGAPQQPLTGVPPPMQATGPAQVVVHVNGPRFGPSPLQMTCPSCQSSIVSSVNSEPGAGAWIAGIVLCVFGCICGCCLIPCCVDSMKIFVHTCPNCKVLLGKYKGSASLG